jgi:gliding motility-associated-like protein
MSERAIVIHALRSFSSRMLLILCCLSFYSAVFSQKVPVVVHIISDNPDAVSDATIIAAINDLNDAFAHAGAYASGPGANTGISFCFALKDPNGGNTNGITRTKSVLSDFDVDIENNRMKNLISWDTKKYMNIWYVQGLKSEIYPEYSCGKWRRMQEGGYATFSSGGDFRDGVVVTGFGTLLAHETGHYLGLKHTFSLNNCANGDCSVDGDGICDTPPQSVFGGSCITPQNSCTSDTLSGFSVDQPDLNVNFMGYSTCANMFTDGQGVKMRDVLATVRNSLLLEDHCVKPCAENILASFTRDNWFPVPGNTINFTSTSSGGSNYEWSVDGVVTGTNSPAFSHTFGALGKYKVTLKVFNASPGCFASYSHNVIVTCGVMARFYPDKRIIASKAPIMLDTILFKNRSVNANSYQWLMANDTGMVETVVSTSADLNYIFQNKGNYRVRLIATNGGCSDTTETFSFRVDDPAFDGSVSIINVDCFQETKLRFSIYVCNNGYAPIPKGVPISFYDGDPRTPGAIKLDTTFIMPDSVLGKCCGKVYILVIDVKRVKFNTLYAVFNDSGKAVPVKFPNTPLDELNYFNNVAIVTGFKYTATIVPSTATLEPGDTLRVIGKGLPTPTVTYAWRSVPELSCTNCPNPLFTARKSDVRLELITRSSFGCTDTGYADIKVPPAEDLTIKIDTVHCYKNDSLLVNFEICNAFKKGIVPKDVKVSFYDADPSSGGKAMGAPFVVPANSSGKCEKYSFRVKGKGPIRLFAVVNDKGVVPFSMPNDSVLIEKDYSNNTTSYDHKVETVTVVPADTAILRKTSVSLSVSSVIYDPLSVTWNNGAGYTLSCTKCLSPSVTVNADGLVTMGMLSQYGCQIKGEAKVKILPPDFTISITGTECYTNTKTLVKFRICMNNGYDSVFRNIPVNFYDTDPYSGRPSPLDSTFFTPETRPGACDSFFAVINSPKGDMLYAAVNDKGRGSFPDQGYNETDNTNNTDQTVVEKFKVSLAPPDTTVYRNTTVQIIATATGGRITSYTWSPSGTLSCINCLDPVVRAPYSQLIIFSAKNQNSCTSSDTADIRTYSDGPVNIPNAFTPNGDGKNDVFYILGSRDIEVLKDFAVYDRYGQKVFQVRNAPPNDPVYGWRGLSKSGTMLPQGTYAYSVMIVFKDDREQLFKGTITLIR